MNTIAVPQPRPFLAIWTDARVAIRHILKTDPDYMVFPLAIAAGVLPFLGHVLLAAAGGLLVMAGTFLVALFVGSVFGLVRLFFISWAIGVTGDWLGGKASREDVQTVVAWSGVPTLAASVLWAPLLLSLAASVGSFAVAGGDPEAALPLLTLPLILSALLGTALRLWSLVILCQGLGEVQEFSVWRVLLNVVLSWVVGLLVLGAVAGVVFLLYR